MIYEFNGLTPKIDPAAYVAREATIIGDVTIGPDCYVGPGAIIRADFPGSPIIIGEGTAVEEGVIIHVGGENMSCIIGKMVTIGHGAIVHCSNISDNANIGMGAIVSIGASVGEYAIVAEGAVVKKGQVIPPRIVVGGAPAKALRELEEKDLPFWDGSKLWYVHLARTYNTPGMLKPIE